MAELAARKSQRADAMTLALGRVQRNKEAFA
jgi:hypothetical protein